MAVNVGAGGEASFGEGDNFEGDAAGRVPGEGVEVVEGACYGGVAGLVTGGFRCWPGEGLFGTCDIEELEAGEENNAEEFERGGERDGCLRCNPSRRGEDSDLLEQV